MTQLAAETKQIPLFGEHVSPADSACPAALARNSDPLSSHLAAEEVTASGRRDSQKREILDWLRHHHHLRGAVTSMELAHSAGIDRYVVARRLSDLEHDGLVVRGPMRVCATSGRMAITWRAREAS